MACGARHVVLSVFGTLYVAARQVARMAAEAGIERLPGRHQGEGARDSSLTAARGDVFGRRSVAALAPSLVFGFLS